MRTLPASVDHIPLLTARLSEREAHALDAFELANAYAVLPAAIAKSSAAFCGFDDDGPLTMCGVIPGVEPGHGRVWQVISPDIDRDLRGYVRWSRAMMPLLASGYDHLRTVVDAGYPAAVQHLRRLGWIYTGTINIAEQPACVCTWTKSA